MDERFGKYGSGYQNQPLIWNAIQKYGWNNITHNQIGLFADEQLAKLFETQCIRKYKTSNPDYGYNIIECDGDRANMNISYHGDAVLYLNNRPYRKLDSMDCLENYNVYDTRDSDWLECRRNDSTKYRFQEYEIGDLNIYHRFITGKYSGLIFVDVYIDDGTHILTRNEYEQYKNNSWFKFRVMAECGVEPIGDYCEVVQQNGFELRNNATKVVFSLLDGSYFISNRNTLDAVYHDNIERLLLLLNNEYELHRNIKYYFYETKKYLCTDDNYMMMKNGKEITGVLREMMKYK